VNVRKLVLTAAALLAFAAPASQACITADKDAAVRMAIGTQGRDTLSTGKHTSKGIAIGSPWLRNYPR
jgi:hypothetical protein